MKKAAFILVLVVSFLALFPLSWRLADPLFTHPFRKDLPSDPVLLVCPDHVEILWLHNLSDGSPVPMGTGCTLNVMPERQKWVEKPVRALPAPNPGKASWQIHVKQVGEAHQQIALELIGDGISGLIYEAKQNVAIPLNSRLTGPLGVVFPLLINVLLWFTVWGLIWVVRKTTVWA